MTPDQCDRCGIFGKVTRVDLLVVDDDSINQEPVWHCDPCRGVCSCPVNPEMRGGFGGIEHASTCRYGRL